MRLQSSRPAPAPDTTFTRALSRNASQLEIVLLACLAASVALTLLLLYDLRLRAQHEAEQTGLSMVRTLAGDIEHNLENFQRSLDGAVSALRIPGIWDAPLQLRNAAIFGASAQVKNLTGMMVVDDRGRLQAYSSGLIAPAVDFSDRDYFKFHKANPDPAVHISGPIVSRLTGEKLVSFSRRINDPDGKFAGAVAGGINLSYFQELFRQLNLGTTGTVALFTADGRRLMREPFDPSVIGLDASSSPLFRHSKEAASGTLIDRSSYDGVERLVAFSSIGHLPFVLAYAQDKSLVFAGWDRTADFITAGAVILWCAQIVVLWQLRRERLGRLAAEQLAHENAIALSDVNRTLEERVQHEVSAREEAHQKLARAQRMEALGQLAGGIAHDFNNVLQAIIGACSLLDHCRGDNQEIERLASHALSAAHRGSAVTRRLLAFARRDQLQAEDIDLKGLLEDLKALLDPTLGSRVAIQVDVSKDLPKLAADRMQLETVLINLATNARDAMPAGGTIKITADSEPVSAAERETFGLPEGPMVRLSVSDSGIGMDAKILARAIEPFFTTKGIGKGTGLGLSMAKGFAEQSGGGLHITSCPGEGTTVTLWLPSSTSPTVTSTLRSEARPYSPARSRTS